MMEHIERPDVPIEKCINHKFKRFSYGGLEFIPFVQRDYKKDCAPKYFYKAVRKREVFWFVVVDGIEPENSPAVVKIINRGG